MSPLCAVPDKNAEAFFQDLLEINYKMYGSWMCKKENWIYVLSLREADGLDQSEVDATLDRVAFYSTDYYSKLSFKYEGCGCQKLRLPIQVVVRLVFPPNSFKFPVGFT